MTVEDLKNHESTFDQPIKTNYRGVDIWEMPPNGQGITALIGLNILRGFDFSSTCGMSSVMATGEATSTLASFPGLPSTSALFPFFCSLICIYYCLEDKNE